VQGRTNVTREHKLALIVGFALVLVVGILVSDHFSKARTSQPVGELTQGTTDQFGSSSGGLRVNTPAPPTIANTLPPPPRTATLPSAPLPGPEIVGSPVFQPQTAPPGAPGSVDGSTGTVLTMGTGPLPSTAGHNPALDSNFISVPTPLAQTGVVPAANIPGLSSPRPDSLDDVKTPSAGELGLIPDAPTTPAPTVTPVVTTPPTPAERSINGVPVSRLTRYEVREGDSIFSIARTHLGDGRLWTRLREFNPGKVGRDGQIREGVSLMLPPRDARSNPATAARTENADRTKPDSKSADTKSDGRKPAAASGTYVVQAGDDLSKIAQKALGNSRRFMEIADLNGLADPDDLQVGMTLKLPKR
jgi:nucleoid-associated protein YgaU